MGRFHQELNHSTNILLQLEAKAFQFADARDERTLGESFTNLLDAFVQNRWALTTNRVELLHEDWGLDSMDWGLDNLVKVKTASEMNADSFRNALANCFRTVYSSKIAAEDAEFAVKKADDAKMVSANKSLQIFERQKQFLTDNTPFDPLGFLRVFPSNFKRTIRGRRRSNCSRYWPLTRPIRRPLRPVLSGRCRQI